MKDKISNFTTVTVFFIHFFFAFKRIYYNLNNIQGATTLQTNNWMAVFREEISLFFVV